jgi:hypothetical protein
MQCDHNLAIQTWRVDVCQYSGSAFGTSNSPFQDSFRFADDPSDRMVAQNEMSKGQPVVTASSAAARCAIQINEEEVRHVAKRAWSDNSC